MAIALARPALATVPDLMGLGARWQGAGGGGVAVVEDGNAAYLNPAGLSRVRRPTAAVGYVYGWPRFTPAPDVYWDTNRDGVLDDTDPALSIDVNPQPMGGVMAQASRNIGGRFGIGFTGYVPTANLIRFGTFEPSLPTWFMYDNRPQRFVLAAGLGGEIVNGLSIGVAVDLLANARIRVAGTLDASVSAPDTTGGELDQLVTDVVVDVHEIDLAVVPALSPVVGVQLDVGELVPPLAGLVLGAAYHHQIGLPLDVQLDLQGNVALEDIGDLDPYITALVVKADLAMLDHFVPRRVTLGLAYRRANALTVYADARWTDWRALQLNVARLTSASLTSPLVDIDDVIRDGNAHTYTVRSTWGFRIGADLQLPEIEVDGKLQYLRLSFRGGFGFEPTPLVDQGTTSNLLDADRSMFTLGLGLEHWDLLDLVNGAVRWDVFAQYHVLARSLLTRSTDRPVAGYPIDAEGFRTGGAIPVIGGQFGFEY